MQKKFMFAILVIMLLLLVSTGAAFAKDNAAPTVSEVVYGMVNYYQNRTLEHWEQLVALDLAGEDLSRWTNLGGWDAEALEASSPATAYAGRILGLLALGEDPFNYHGTNLVSALKDRQSSNGSFGGTVNNTVWSVIALDQAGASYNVGTAVSYLLSQQKSDGGYAISGSAGDPDLTGDVLIALSKHRSMAGVEEAIQRAVAFLKAAQLESAGFASWGSENSQSTAKVIAGLMAIGEDILAPEWQKNGKTMVDALFAYRLPDNSFKYTLDGGSNEMATRQVLKALAELEQNGYGEYAPSLPSPDPGGGGDPQEPVKVTVRVEGVADTGTILEEREVEVPAGSRLFAALAKALDEAGVPNTVADIPDDGWLSLGDIEVNTQYDIGHMYWLYTVDDDLNTAANPVLADGNRIVVYLSEWPTTVYAKLTVDQEEVTKGERVTVKVEKSDGGWPATYIPAAGVIVKFGTHEAITDAEGKAVFTAENTGTYAVYAEKYNEHGIPDIVKTAKVLVKVVSPGAPVKDEIEVFVEIVGQKRTYFSDYVTLPKDRATALDALKATGVSFKARDNESYVYEIGGEREDLSSTAGWKYKVGSRIPNVPAKEYVLRDGDELLWFWAEDYTATEPVEPVRREQQIKQELPLAKALSDAIAEAVVRLTERVAQEISGQIIPVEIAGELSIVVGLDRPLTGKEKEDLAVLLQDNVVLLVQKVEANQESNVTDAQNEINLLIGKHALREVTEITVKELTTPNEVGLPATHRLLSPVYEFGPDGTEFGEAVYLSIRVVIPEGVDPEAIVLAWYSEAQDQWFIVPTVIDVSTGTVTGSVQHFTKFAVLVRERQPVQFEDVNAERYPWAANEISYLATKGILQGVGDGKFAPERGLNRAELTAMLVKALKLDEVAEYQGSFTDVDGNAWYAKYVQAALERGLIKGLTENTFGPNEPVTREQLAVLLARILDEKQSGKATLGFKDNDQIAAWAVEGVSKAVSAGLLQGFPDDTFRPREVVNRAASAVVIYRLLLEY